MNRDCSTMPGGDLIAHGRTKSYRQAAEQVGRPVTARAVTAACATNPLLHLEAA